MLNYNQNGITEKHKNRINDYRQKVDFCRTSNRSSANEGWIGIFNRDEYREFIKLDKKQLGLNKNDSYELYDIWGKRMIEDAESIYFDIPREDLIFLHYKAKTSY